ncbi:hypothetical protein K492DRAFT_241019 [Lichtheimia hyalospora FSU 10163]|nr:hypothetical protein K492DRAFT_241019 [Lichtheimia hyalospora FSU 10163]
MKPKNRSAQRTIINFEEPFEYARAYFIDNFGVRLPGWMWAEQAAIPLDDGNDDIRDRNTTPVINDGNDDSREGDTHANNSTMISPAPQQSSMDNQASNHGDDSTSSVSLSSSRHAYSLRARKPQCPYVQPPFASGSPKIILSSDVKVGD